MLEVSGLTTGYEGVQVLRGIDIHVGDRETVAVLGANGAGKTTALRAIMRQLPVWSGSIGLLGEDVTHAAAYTPARLGVGYVPEGRGMLSALTVLENLEMGSYPRRARPNRVDNLERVLDIFPALQSRLSDRAANLSGGQQQMLAIGRALMNSPRLVILDEPSLGLAPAVVDQVYEALSTLRTEGQAILLVEQNVARALELSDRAYVLERGRVVISGDTHAVAGDPRVQASYLGL
jgi:branched-chain amino acid transport system ATP-binding protein